MRLRSYNEKPGLVKIRLSSVEDKVAALRRKRNLHQAGYGSVFIRSSQSHTDRLIQQNIHTMLRELPNGDNYMVTGNGRLVKKDFSKRMGAWSRGPPVSSGSERGSIGGRGRGRGRGRVLTDVTE